MSNTTATYWSVNGESIQTYAYNIQTWGGDAQGAPSLRGSDLVVPYASGEMWMDKVPDARTISFSMWVIGANEDGSFPVEGSSRRLFEQNWRRLRALFWNPHKQIKLTKRFKDWTSGEIIEATALAQFAGGLTPTMQGTQRAQFTVQLKLADPFFYSDAVEVEISPYDETVTNTVKTPSPIKNLTGFGYEGTSGTLVSKVAYRRPVTTPNPVYIDGAWIYPSGPAMLYGVGLESAMAKLTYKTEQASKTGGITAGNSSSNAVTVTAGEQRKFSMRVALPVRANRMRAWVEFYDNSGAAVGTRVYGPSTAVPKSSNPETVDIAPGAWTKLRTGNVTVPAGATRARLGASVAADGTDWVADRTNYAEDPSFEGTYALSEIARNRVKNPVFAHAPATFDATPLYTNIHTNPNGVTTSGDVVIERNYIPNSSFEPGFIMGWTWRSTPVGVASRSIVQDATAHSGKYYQRISGTTAAAVGRTVTTTKNTPAGPVTYSAYFRGNNATVKMTLIEETAADTVGTATATHTLSNASGWVRYSVTLTNQRANTRNRIELEYTSVGSALMTNIGTDSAMLNVGTEPAEYFYEGTATSGNGAVFFKVDPAQVLDALNNVGGSMKYYKQPVGFTANTAGVIAARSNYTGTVPNASNSVSLVAQEPGATAALGAHIYTTTAADVGKPITVTAYALITAGYDASSDLPLGGNYVSRGIYLENQPAAGQAQAPSVTGSHIVRVTITPTAANQRIRLGGGGTSASEVVRWAKVTVVKGNYTGLPFAGSDPATDGGNIQYLWRGMANRATTEIQGKVPTGVSRDLYSDLGVYRTTAYSYEGAYALAIKRTGSATAVGLGVSLGTYPAGRYLVDAVCYVPTGYDDSEDITTSPFQAPRAIGVLNVAGVTDQYIQAPATPGVHRLTGEIELKATNKLKLTGGGLTGQEVIWGAVSLIPLTGSVNSNILGAPFSGNTTRTDFTIEWAGTPHNSDSVVQVRTLTGGLTASTQSNSMPTIISRVWKDQGNQSLRGISRATGDGSLAKMYLDSSWVPTAAGTYTIRAKVRVPSVMTGNSIADARRFRLVSGAVNLVSPTVLNQVGTYDVNWNFTVPAGVTSWSEFSFIAGHENSEVFIDSMIITNNTYTGPYFDGNSSTASWTGEAYNSTSKTVPDIIYANKFAAVDADSPYDYFSGDGVDSTETEMGDYFFGWAGVAQNSISTLYEQVTTPYPVEVIGDYQTHKIEFEIEKNISSFTLTNQHADGKVEMTYGWGTENEATNINVEKFISRTGAQKTSAYVDHSGSHYWFVLRPGINNISTAGTGTGNLIMKYRPAWL